MAGGRSVVGGALDMATFGAVPYDGHPQCLLPLLRAAGKKLQVALVACLRKLVVLMNRLLKKPKFQLAH